MNRYFLATLALTAVILSACIAPPVRPRATLPAPVSSSTTPQPLVVIPIADAAATTLTVDGFPDWLEIGFGSLWVSSPSMAAIQRIDLKTKQVVSKILIPTPCAAMTLGFDALWVANCSTSEIFRIDARTNEIVAKIKAPLATSESSISAGEGGVWLVSDYRGILTRIDPDTNKVVAEIKIKRESSAAIAGYGGVWVTNTGGYSSKEGTVQRIDPLTNSIVATITVGGHPRFLAVGEGAVWVLNQIEGTVSRIDPQTNQVVATIDSGVVGEGGDIAAGEGAVWVRGATVLLVVIDPATNQVTKRYGPSQGSGAVRAREGGVWISAHDVSRIWGLKP